MLFEDDKVIQTTVNLILELLLSEYCNDITIDIKNNNNSINFVFICDSLDDSIRHFLIRLIKKDELSSRELLKFEKYLCLRDILSDIVMETSDEKTTIKLLYKY